MEAATETESSKIDHEKVARAMSIVRDNGFANTFNATTIQHALEKLKVHDDTSRYDKDREALEYVLNHGYYNR